MKAALRLCGPLIASTFVAALAACASHPTEHFYTVWSGNVAPGVAVSSQQIVVSRIVIPALVDRPQLVVRTTGHEVEVLENHRWAEPLSTGLARALVNDLRRERPNLSVAGPDVSAGRASGLILDVVITELVGRPGSSTSLEASWALRDRSTKCVQEGSLEADIPTQAGYESIPIGYADAMSRLAGAIAHSIPEGGNLSCPLSAGSGSVATKY